MTADTSRSCLGLETCVGSVIRQIVDARVLLTATVSPALPGRSVSDGSLAPPLNRIMLVFRLACRYRHLPGDGPDEASQFAGDRGGDDIGRLAGPGEPAIAAAQPDLPLPGDVADGPRLALLPQQQLAAEPGREAVAPGRLDQQPASRSVAGLGDAAAFDARAARMFGRHQPEIGHQLTRIGEAREIAQFGNQSGRIVSICAVSRSRRIWATSTAAM